MNQQRNGLLVMVASLFAATTLFAGGWAVITVEALPEYIHAGEPFAIAYTVRQHGQRLVGGLHGRVEARAGEHQVVADAQPGDYQGHYVAKLEVPKPGEWSITIQSGFGGHGTLALVPLRAVARTASAAALHPADRGRHLFVAKGCATCHRIDGKGVPAGLHTPGPQLLPRKFQSDYLAGILTNPGQLPASANYAFRMPNLGLDAEEVSALVAFINDRRSDASGDGRRPEDFQ